MKYFIFLFLPVFFFSIATAQQNISLQQCIDIALKNSQQIQEAQYLNTLSDISLKQAKAQRLPAVNASVRHGSNTGRSIDPFSNQFINQTISTSAYGIDLDLPLFNGLQLTNTIKRNSASQSAAENDNEVTKNLLVFSVIRLFLQAVSSQQIIKATQLQLATIQEQISNAEKRVNAGVLAATQLADLETQAATEEINLVNSINNLETNKLDLFLAMNFVSNDVFVFLPPAEIDILAEKSVPDATTLYQAALVHFPDIKSAEQRKKAAEWDIKITQSYYYPTLSLYGYAGTTYSSSVGKTRFVPDGTYTNTVATSSTNFVSVGNDNYFVKEAQQIKNGTQKPFTYLNQLDANINAGAGISLRIPLLNALQARNRMANAKANMYRWHTQAAAVKNQLQNAVGLSLQNLKIARERILLTEKQVKALEQSVENATARMNAGTANTIEYVLVKSNYDRAAVNLIGLKNEYCLRYKIVQFYETGKW